MFFISGNNNYGQLSLGDFEDGNDLCQCASNSFGKQNKNIKMFNNKSFE